MRLLHAEQPNGRNRKFKRPWRYATLSRQAFSLVFFVHFWHSGRSIDRGELEMWVLWALLEEKFILILQRMGCNLYEIFCKQGAMSPHTPNTVLAVLNTNFSEWVILQQAIITLTKGLGETLVRTHLHAMSFHWPFLT